ncbi:CCAAT-binding factor subunit A (HAP3) protein [Dioscorea alata]|uniref:CCAAT-binding factor subunit A (HAP3) protein n=1 Tax=Dioscorea alata TaxID=55571 RepID=A0ACB7VQI3_DIOAL|nr:CCAAT-binding factor subunit A (HAP3) protein [Dioscorea alata]
MSENKGSSSSEHRNEFTVGGSSSGVIAGDVSVKEQDRLLPIANVGRIMKQILPPNAKISKEAKETMQECVSEFISFVTGEASDKCHKEKRKTVNGDDICWALGSLGFDNYCEPMKLYLQRYREIEGDRTAAVAGGISKVGGSDARDDHMKDDDDHGSSSMFNAMEKNSSSLAPRRY